VPVSAHEFWIEPSSYQLDTPQPVEIMLRVGENFRGSPQSYLPSEIQAFAQVNQTTERIPGLLGDSRPAATITPTRGLNRILHWTAPSVIEFAAGDVRWPDYIALDGLTRQLARHPQVQQVTPVTEHYVRTAKSLITVGQGPFEDQRTDIMPFEIVRQGRFDRLTTGAHTFQLHTTAHPAQDVLIKAFRHSDRAVVDQAYTDTDGQVTLTLPTGDTYLISGVVIAPDPDPTSDWISHWPSLTLSVVE
jgi:hypothetical protein